MERIALFTRIMAIFLRTQCRGPGGRSDSAAEKPQQVSQPKLSRTSRKCMTCRLRLCHTVVRLVRHRKRCVRRHQLQHQVQTGTQILRDHLSGLHAINWRTHAMAGNYATHHRQRRSTRWTLTMPREPLGHRLRLLAAMSLGTGRTLFRANIEHLIHNFVATCLE